LKQFGGTHLEADEYHEAMKDPEAVIIDVRNAYESAM
jgi:predicted sulfurtransferase